jgi:hypothetical protein
MTESEILMVFLKQPSYMTSAQIIITSNGLGRVPDEITSINLAIERFAGVNILKERDAKDGFYYLTEAGIEEAIKLFIFKDNYPLNKYERGIINYSISNLHHWRGQINVRQNVTNYLIKDVGVLKPPNNLVSILSKSVKDYLYTNDFITNSPNSHSIWEFSPTKGERLFKLEKIEKYWEYEKNRAEMPITEYFKSIQKEEEEQELKDALLNEKLKNLINTTFPEKESKTEYHFHDKVEGSQFFHGDKNSTNQNNTKTEIPLTPVKGLIFGMSWKTIKEGVAYTIIAAAIIAVFTLLTTKVGCNEANSKKNNAAQQQPQAHSK